MQIYSFSPSPAQSIMWRSCKCWVESITSNPKCKIHLFIPIVLNISKLGSTQGLQVLSQFIIFLPTCLCVDIQNWAALLDGLISCPAVYSCIHLGSNCIRVPQDISDIQQINIICFQGHCSRMSKSMRRQRIRKSLTTDGCVAFLLESPCIVLIKARGRFEMLWRL